MNTVVKNGKTYRKFMDEEMLLRFSIIMDNLNELKRDFENSHDNYNLEICEEAEQKLKEFVVLGEIPDEDTEDPEIILVTDI